MEQNNGFIWQILKGLLLFIIFKINCPENQLKLGHQVKSWFAKMKSRKLQINKKETYEINQCYDPTKCTEVVTTDFCCLNV